MWCFFMQRIVYSTRPSRFCGCRLYHDQYVLKFMVAPIHSRAREAAASPCKTGTIFVPLAVGTCVPALNDHRPFSLSCARCHAALCGHLASLRFFNLMVGRHVFVAVDYRSSSTDRGRDRSSRKDRHRDRDDRDRRSSRRSRSRDRDSGR